MLSGPPGSRNLRVAPINLCVVHLQGGVGGAHGLRQMFRETCGQPVGLVASEVQPDPVCALPGMDPEVVQSWAGLPGRQPGPLPFPLRVRGRLAWPGACWGLAWAFTPTALPSCSRTARGGPAVVWRWSLPQKALC